MKEILISKVQKRRCDGRRTCPISSARRASVTARSRRRTWSAWSRDLAWTEVGGELLTIEGVILPGKGKMTVTGNLEDVMKESISAAASYVRSRAVDFGIEPPIFDRKDIHVHVPEGATPKDGPSAGIAMATAIVSVMTGIPVRRDVAMTGEVTLRGRVLPIGGLKEKLLAALRGGIKKVLIPEENAKDLVDLPESVKNGLEIVPVARGWIRFSSTRWCACRSRSNGTRRRPAKPAAPAARRGFTGSSPTRLGDVKTPQAPGQTIRGLFSCGRRKTGLI